MDIVEEVLVLPHVPSVHLRSLDHKDPIQRSHDAQADEYGQSAKCQHFVGAVCTPREAVEDECHLKEAKPNHKKEHVPVAPHVDLLRQKCVEQTEK